MVKRLTLKPRGPVQVLQGSGIVRASPPGRSIPIYKGHGTTQLKKEKKMIRIKEKKNKVNKV